MWGKGIVRRCQICDLEEHVTQYTYLRTLYGLRDPGVMRLKTDLLILLSRLSPGKLYRRIINLRRGLRGDRQLSYLLRKLRKFRISFFHNCSRRKPRLR